jgi:3-oxoacyl-[acyl-carrier protein] reductase
MHHIAFVTGAARGIGKAIAMQLAKDGMKVIIGDIDENGARTTAGEIAEKYDVSAAGFLLDVADPVSMQETIKKAMREIGHIDVLVNNAGIIGERKAFEEYRLEDWDKVFRVNLMGTVFGIQQVLQGMKKRGYGRIINISSMSAYMGAYKASHAYFSSKAAIIGLTKGLANEFGPMGITVNAVVPGLIISDLTATGSQDGTYNLEIIPVRKMGTVSDVARAVSYLASEDAGYVTGVSMDVNGGQILR